MENMNHAFGLSSMMLLLLIDQQASCMQSGFSVQPRFTFTALLANE
jgi:hypothetical protein